MAIYAQLAGINKPAEPVTAGVANGGSVASLALATPMTPGEHGAAKVQLAQLSINIGVGNGFPTYAPPLYPSVPTYYGWMGPSFMAVPAYRPGYEIIIYSGRYYQVPQRYWRERDYHWHNHDWGHRHHHRHGW